MSGVHVKSTNLRSVHYDADKKMLEVELYPGQRYQYLDVPNQLYDELLQAESALHFFDQHIRLCFRHRRVIQI
jgi:hypothetical protein